MRVTSQEPEAPVTVTQETPQGTVQETVQETVKETTIAPPQLPAAEETVPAPAQQPVVPETVMTPPQLPAVQESARPVTPAAERTDTKSGVDSGLRFGVVDVERFSRNLARLVEQGGRALAAYLRPREEGRISDEVAAELGEIVKTLGHVAKYWLEDPQRAVAAQNRLGKAYLELWASASRRLAGEPVSDIIAPAPGDKRFSDPEWTSNQFFDFLKQGYLLTSEWADKLVADAADLDPHTRQKAEFYVRQITNAIAPTNFVLTNPELLRETFASGAENLVRGMSMLAEDIEAGHGELKIRQSDASMFEVGRNLAVTPGKVIFQNEMMQLIQYAPTTEMVLKRPLLIVPPWINKFYVLDLTPEKSFIKWCVDQGITVFCVSWVNPDVHLAQKTFEDYVRQGPLAALDAIKEATGEDKVHSIGYCVGGTLLAVTLAAMAAWHDERIVSATLFAAQVDFTYAGDLKVFVDEEQVAAIEQKMAERGFLDSGAMASVFNLLRSNDLIWPYVINNYLKGKAPFPFDLLYWNSDATRLPAANHSFYLRNCYLDNKLSKGKMVLGNTPIDLKAITIPIYNLATREDHIAPAKSVMVGSKSFGGDVRFVVSGSGHIAGVINPPAKRKYQYWTGPKPRNADINSWLAKAKEHTGSWWPDWLLWITRQSPTEVAARVPGAGALPAIEDAPGSYVKVRG
ncbi:MAG TPA: class I poly(R)-hydroxyalkanoic acid synthase [Xanthobacteraceae bacterium]|nr:class I poly(R)-hydroxyalkanoic acid synthase [Xanthobacteraceae bacterium]